MMATEGSSEEVRTRRSALAGLSTGCPVMMTTRNRSCVTGDPVLLVKRRRMVIVPNVALFAGSEVRSRDRLGAADEACDASSMNPLNCELRTMGDVVFSGPGAPSVD
jgi:hypothetical protein